MCGEMRNQKVLVYVKNIIDKKVKWEEIIDKES